MQKREFRTQIFSLATDLLMSIHSPFSGPRASKPHNFFDLLSYTDDHKRECIHTKGQELSSIGNREKTSKGVRMCGC